MVPDLEINKLDDPDPVTTEDVLLYTISLTNEGSIPIAANRLQVVDDLPLNQVDWVSIESDEFNCQPPSPTGLVQCVPTNTLDPNENISVDIVVEPEVAGTIQNVAGVFYDPPTLPNTLVDTDTEQTTVESSGNNNDNNNGGGNNNNNGNNSNNGNTFTFQYDDTSDDTNDDTNDTTDAGTTDTNSDTGTTPDNGSGVVADAGGTNPDTLPPQSTPRGDVANDIPFNEPLPPTGGISPLILLSGATLMVVGAVLVLRKIR